ncbi:cystathionine beta-lyase PatB [Clostridium homopropionicum DSM 5847]|uniref:cysteine-S-conjugate beta-lyase n=1 Tax=Clostridium homopropionicum DSM 5847 TaxID=1121318 RepID=A0A0L6ZDF3_9CLOT|nr:MalY/PatB family protein [Clostridium homopropionicum]KOA20818.1 cystathionine beta-lyase PatB [Clostridium homopropionicum DSM 5847]SFF88361.1 cystathione beta-lyase [Clostridium homopropionicum]
MNKQEFLEKYLIERRGTDCFKWDELESRYGDPNLIPMWIADMEFKTPDQIIEAMVERAKHGVFGYSSVSEEYYKAFSDWMSERYHFPIKKEWVRFSTGCITVIAWMIHAFTNPGDACLILTPVYYPFHNVVTSNGRELVSVDLDYNEGYFTMNYEAIEKAIVENQVKMFIQCSPHNPVGRVWSEEELEEILAICKKYNVLVVSDEIHQDIVLGENPFIPSAVVSDGLYGDIVITVSSASKTFNLAGLLHSHIVITNENLMKIYDKFARGMNRTEMNIMGLTATMKGYTHGGEWLSNLMGVIRDNYNYLKKELHEKLPDVTVCALEGTYLVLLDMRKCIEAERLVEFIQGRCHLAVDYGECFGENFKGFIRLNLATDPKYVKTAVENIIAEASKL